VGEEGRGHAAGFKESSLAAIGGRGRHAAELWHVSLLAGDGRATLDAQFWHFLFGFRPESLQKICSLMYTLHIVYRD
jgi:hypothetical protein